MSTYYINEGGMLWVYGQPRGWSPALILYKYVSRMTTYTTLVCQAARMPLHLVVAYTTCAQTSDIRAIWHVEPPHA